MLSLIAALIYMILRTRRLSRLPLYWGLGLAGFLFAQALVEGAGVQSPTVGELQMVPDMIGVVMVLCGVALVGL